MHKFKHKSSFHDIYRLRRLTPFVFASLISKINPWSVVHDVKKNKMQNAITSIRYVIWFPSLWEIGHNACFLWLLLGKKHSWSFFEDFQLWRVHLPGNLQRFMFPFTGIMHALSPHCSEIWLPRFIVLNLLPPYWSFAGSSVRVGPGHWGRWFVS